MKKKQGFTLPPVKSKICSLLRLRSAATAAGEGFGSAVKLLVFPPSPHTPSGQLAFTKRKALSSSFAFTLAEVLITLAIIGVVAALTIPTVIRNYQKTQTMAQFKKIYSTLSRATNLVAAEYGPPETWYFTDGSNDETEKIFLMYKPYLSFIKTCKNTTGCWSKDITKTLAGNNMLWAQSAGIGSNIYVIVLKDGTTVSIDLFGNSPYDYFGVTRSSKIQGPNILFTADLNGDKKPNRSGRDVFHFIITDKGLTPAGRDNNSVQCTKTNTTDRGGFDCAAKILKEDDITYW